MHDARGLLIAHKPALRLVCWRESVMHTLSKDELLRVNGGVNISVDGLKQMAGKLGREGKELLFAAGRGLYKALNWSVTVYAKIVTPSMIDGVDYDCMADECWEQQDNGV